MSGWSALSVERQDASACSKSGTASSHRPEFEQLGSGGVAHRRLADPRLDDRVRDLAFARIVMRRHTWLWHQVCGVAVDRRLRLTRQY
jgi:hypothetical protein